MGVDFDGIRCTFCSILLKDSDHRYCISLTAATARNAKHRLNREIMAPEVRLIGPENEPLGVVSHAEALRMAGEQDVDLVEIVAAANPPVCRLIDYGKFKYHEQKQAAEAKSKQKVIEVKEVKFRPGTDEGDYQHQDAQHPALHRGRRRQGQDHAALPRPRDHPPGHRPARCCERIRDELADLTVVEHMPKLEGRQMIMVLAPGRKKAVAAKPSEAAEPTAAPAA